MSVQGPDVAAVSDSAWQSDLLVNGEPFVGAYSNDGTGDRLVVYGKSEQSPKGERFKGIRLFRDGKPELVRVGKAFLAGIQAFRVSDRAKISSLVKTADAAVRNLIARGITVVRELDEADRAFAKAVVDRVVSAGRGAVSAAARSVSAGAVQKAVSAVRSGTSRIGRRDSVREFMKMEQSQAFFDDVLVAQMKSLRDAVVHARTNRYGSVLPMFLTKETNPDLAAADLNAEYFEHPSVCLNVKGKALHGMAQLAAMVACSQVSSADNFFVIAGGRDSSPYATEFSLAKISSVGSDGYPVKGSEVQKGTFHLYSGNFSGKLASVVDFRKSQLNAPNPNALFIDGTDPHLSCKEFMARYLAVAELGIAFKTTDSQKLRCREEFLKLAESLDKGQYGNFWKDFDSDLRSGSRAQARNFLDRRRIELANAKSMRNMPSVGQVFRKERDAAAMEM